MLKTWPLDSHPFTSEHPLPSNTQEKLQIFEGRHTNFFRGQSGVPPEKVQGWYLLLAAISPGARSVRVEISRTANYHDFCHQNGLTLPSRGENSSPRIA